MNQHQHLIMMDGDWDTAKLVCPRCLCAVASLVPLEGNPGTHKEILSFVCSDTQCRCWGIFIVDAETGEVTPVVDQEE